MRYYLTPKGLDEIQKKRSILDKTKKFIKEGASVSSVNYKYLETEILNKFYKKHPIVGATKEQLFNALGDPSFDQKSRTIIIQAIRNMKKRGLIEYADKSSIQESDGDKNIRIVPFVKPENDNNSIRVTITPAKVTLNPIHTDKPSKFYFKKPLETLAKIINLIKLKVGLVLQDEVISK